MKKNRSILSAAVIGLALFAASAPLFAEGMVVNIASTFPPDSP